MLRIETRQRQDRALIHRLQSNLSRLTGSPRIRSAKRAFSLPKQRHTSATDQHFHINMSSSPESLGVIPTLSASSDSRPHANLPFGRNTFLKVVFFFFFFFRDSFSFFESLAPFTHRHVQHTELWFMERHRLTGTGHSRSRFLFNLVFWLD